VSSRSEEHFAKMASPAIVGADKIDFQVIFL